MGRSLLTSLLLVSVLLTPARAQEPNDAGNAPPQEGTVLVADTFDDPENGALPKVSPDPTRSSMGYVDGEYVLRTFSAGNARVSIPVAYSDYSVAVDAWIVGDSSENLIEIGLRRQETGTKDYRLALQNGRRIILRRWDDPNGPFLGQMDLPSNLQPSDGRYHLELLAFGRNIVAKVNGAVVIAAQDDTYQSGTAWIGVLSNSGAVEARFDNLVITKQNASEPAPPLGVVPATAAPIAPTAQPAVQAPGSVLLSDNFDDPAAGRLAKSSSDPRKAQGYVDGEYEIRTLDAPAGYVWVASVPGTYSDAAVAVDARLVSADALRYVSLACRTSSSGSGYRLSVYPGNRAVRIERSDGSSTTVLVERPVAVIGRMSSVNRAELICAGSRISAQINGRAVASAQDDTYAAGGMWIGAGTADSTVAARFDNLVVTQRDPTEPPPAIPPPPKAGDVILTDDFGGAATGWLPTSSPNAWEQVRYVDGEYEIRKTDWLARFLANVQIPGSYADATVRLDGRLLADGDYLVLICRSNRSGQYRLSVYPWSREYILARVDRQGDSSNFTTFARGQSPAVNVGAAVNRMELSCVGDSIEARVNDVRVASAQDGAHQSGGFLFGASANNSTATARFDNLVVIQR